MPRFERGAAGEGIRPIFDGGLRAVLEGDTTIKEVVRCIRTETRGLLLHLCYDLPFSLSLLSS